MRRRYTTPAQKTKKLEGDLLRAESKLEVLAVIDDLVTAMDTSNGGLEWCAMCNYEFARDRNLVDAWEAENDHMIERWLRHNRIQTVPDLRLGHCKHLTAPLAMSWYVEKRWHESA